MTTYRIIPTGRHPYTHKVVSSDGWETAALSEGEANAYIRNAMADDERKAREAEMVKFPEGWG